VAGYFFSELILRSEYNR